MPFEIIRDDITKIDVDAIVNAANSSLLGGGGVDGAIHRAAGYKLLEECRGLGGCKVGEAKITKGYDLPSRYVIHTVGPVWQGGGLHEDELLYDCYKNSLSLASNYSLESIAFPLISSGAFGYPKARALKIAISAISDFLLEKDMKIILVVYDKAAFSISEKLFSSIEEYIDDRYLEDRPYESRDINREAGIFYLNKVYEETVKKSYQESVEKEHKRNLAGVVNQLDDTFSQRLLGLIDEKQLTDAMTYKRANIDRKLFSKIRNDIYYRPSKPTAIAFAIALELNLDETKDLLLRAGYALSHSNKFDLIIEYFIQNKNYDIFEINEALFAFDQNLLGGWWFVAY